MDACKLTGSDGNAAEVDAARVPLGGRRQKFDSNWHFQFQYQCLVLFVTGSWAFKRYRLLALFLRGVRYSEFQLLKATRPFLPGNQNLTEKSDM